MQFLFQSFNVFNLDTDNIIAVSCAKDKGTSDRKQRIQCASAYHVTHFMISAPSKQFSLLLNDHVTVHIQSVII